MPYSDQHYLLLFANCVPVKGIRRSIVYDLQRNDFEFIPNELYTILTRHTRKTIGQIKDLFDRECDDIVDEYIDFIIQKEFAIVVQHPDKGFVKLRVGYEVPNAISNCIIDVDANSKHPFSKIKQELDALACQALQLRFYDPVTIDELQICLNHFQDSRLRSIEVMLPFSGNITSEVIIALGTRHPRLLYMVISGAPENKNEEFEKLLVIHTKNDFQSENCCGAIDSLYFRVNMRAFNEAKLFNSCLNKKISIDKKGFIRNCPSTKEVYGHIYDQHLSGVVEQDDFKTYWDISKDKINICKVCEFRYMCSDCRAYTEDPEDCYSKPLKCGYDPNTTNWEQWSTHPLKQKAIHHYAGQDKKTIT